MPAGLGCWEARREITSLTSRQNRKEAIDLQSSSRFENCDSVDFSALSCHRFTQITTGVSARVGILTSTMALMIT